MSSRIPAREPLGDPIDALLTRVDNTHLLSKSALPQGEIVHDGTLLVRYGVTLLGKPQLSVVPGLLALDTGVFMTGEEMWHFLLNKSNLYPRADVLGYRENGEDDMVVLKALDLLHPFHILVYPDADATQPLALVDAVIAPDADQLPERLREYATIYATFDDWKATQTE